ncbi:hypothetical protein ACQPZX_41300 [Actinoplanes sp. CA-142083]|uniref:hypothetical protein n=1 Tax=Actinoplanes sp. CA-142083 TaxID=3239903 RepID=UPI003D949C17
MTQKLIARYYELRETHVEAGGIAAGADRLADSGDYAAAARWLRKATKHSDFVHNPRGGAR